MTGVRVKLIGRRVKISWTECRRVKGLTLLYMYKNVWIKEIELQCINIEPRLRRDAL